MLDPFGPPTTNKSPSSPCIHTRKAPVCVRVWGVSLCDGLYVHSHLSYSAPCLPSPLEHSSMDTPTVESVIEQYRPSLAPGQPLVVQRGAAHGLLAALTAAATDSQLDDLDDPTGRAVLDLVMAAAAHEDNQVCGGLPWALAGDASINHHSHSPLEFRSLLPPPPHHHQWCGYRLFVGPRGRAGSPALSLRTATWSDTHTTPPP